jgi:hypothetical protein
MRSAIAAPSVKPRIPLQALPLTVSGTLNVIPSGELSRFIMALPVSALNVECFEPNWNPSTSLSPSASGYRGRYGECFQPFY